MNQYDNYWVNIKANVNLRLRFFNTERAKVQLCSGFDFLFFVQGKS